MREALIVAGFGTLAAPDGLAIIARALEEAFPECAVRRAVLSETIRARLNARGVRADGLAEAVSRLRGEGAGRIAVAAAYLPLSDSNLIPKSLGTRHRAAVGISEVTDALTVVISEETGGVTITQNNELMRDLTREDYLKILRNELLPQADSKYRLFGRSGTKHHAHTAHRRKRGRHVK